MKQPTPDMVEALKTFAARYGRTWRTDLVCRWMNGRDDYEPEGPTLRAIRNNLGPVWLDSYCLIGVDRLTFAAVHRELATLEIVIRKRDSAGEFRVNYRGGDEATASYTPDLEDALGTGRAMAAERDRRQA
ncbi:hypothetical protein [Microvirga massiliensis]|uniref:hypothetical protein n=1 Tax=Microvirga massiliensis TaxID=1033741 RepID=UPI000660F1D9|nr:hypothetical protein [Microvirga massiliensis]